MAYRTLGDLRGELMARLGMGAQGASGASQLLMNSFLRNGQAQLYRAQDWKHLTDYADRDLGVDQNLLDYPPSGTFNATVGCARDKRILKVETYYAGQWRALSEGIGTREWNFMDTKSWPARFERFAQMMVYPKADQIYQMRLWFVRDLGAFTADNDPATLDDDMILLHAIANGKAHYRHPDAAQYQGQLSQLMASLRGQSFGVGANAVVRRNESLGGSDPRPAVVGRDV